MAVAEAAWESREQGREPTTTLSGWRKFVDTAPVKFDLLPDAAWTGLSPASRDAYDEARITYHSELVVVATSTLREVTKQGRLLTLLNRREISARRGLIVSGPWATGKSTAIKQLGRTYELMIQERAAGSDRNPSTLSDRIPVVYVTTPPKGSPRKLALEFARFLGLPPVRSRWNTTDIADAVCQVLIEARCDLVLVDEIHNLNLATAAGEDMSDHLKYFTEHLPATFVYAGINVERSGLFTGVRGKQIAGRCVMTSTGPFPYQQEWKSLVATMESALRLHRHQPGTLPGMDRYLHQRTGGMIGSLSHLIRAGAIMAIMAGSEVISQELSTESRSTTRPSLFARAPDDGLRRRTRPEAFTAVGETIPWRDHVVIPRAARIRKPPRRRCSAALYHWEQADPDRACRSAGNHYFGACPGTRVRCRRPT